MGTPARAAWVAASAPKPRGGKTGSDSLRLPHMVLHESAVKQSGSWESEGGRVRTSSHKGRGDRSLARPPIAPLVGATEPGE